jgi:hypothetical protein
MLQRNTRLAFGSNAPRFECFARLDLADERVAIDGRLHVWEWLVVGGELIKIDAVDHCASHDLVGCQPIAWDVAGACVELGLGSEECARLCAIVEAVSRRAIDPELVSFCTACYAAFELGRYTLALDIADQTEVPRLRAAVARYAAVLQACSSQ